MAKKPAASSSDEPQNFREWKAANSDSFGEISDAEPKIEEDIQPDAVVTERTEFGLGDAVKMLAPSCPGAVPGEMYDTARFLFREFVTGMVPTDGIEREVWEKWNAARPKKGTSDV
jgi:hypothetical protein